MSTASAKKSEESIQSRRIDFQAPLRGRASKEIVIAFMGAVGCGLPRLINDCESDLKSRGYVVERIRLSGFIKAELARRGESLASPRYIQYQDVGNALRNEKALDIFASYAINQIARKKASRDPAELERSTPAPKVAYLIDQIKHPEEIRLLRFVYRKLFYAVGVMSTAKDRRNRLIDEGLTEESAEEVMRRDRKDAEPHGQHLEKAFKMADYFIHHPTGEGEVAKEQLKRFGNILHGDNTVSPTKQEYAMYVAHSTGLKSACLSRQVGAAILDADGNLVAVGTNDVPKHGGGLYSTDSLQDHRCIHNRVCENDKQKNKRYKNMIDGLRDYLSSDRFIAGDDVRSMIVSSAEAIAGEAYKLSGVGDLIEFSRAVHAEMDALISLSRGTAGSSVGGSLFTTTFPCHNCARHIIAAGIQKVFYIEPYEKSLALDSHSDAIELLDYDHPEQPSPAKVKFIHFSGVAPGMYADVFHRPDGRKVDGKLANYCGEDGDQQSKIVREYLDSYRDFEVKISAMFESSETVPLTAVPPPAA